MTEKKREMVKIILDLIFSDSNCVVMWEAPGMFPEEQRVEFTRPLKEMTERYLISWYPTGDITVWRIGSRGAMHPVHCDSSRWFRVAKYLQANFVSTQSILKIINV